MNKTLGSGTPVINTEVKALVTSHSGYIIQFPCPKQKNKAMMCHSKKTAIDKIAETFCTIDSVYTCAKIIRESLFKVDFDLQENFYTV